MTVLPNARRRRSLSSGDGSVRVSLPGHLSSTTQRQGLYGTGLSTDDFAQMDPADALATYRTGRAENSLERGDPDPNEATTQAIVRLLQSPSQKARDKGVKSLQDNYDAVTPKLAEKYGIAKIREDYKPQGDAPAWKKYLLSPTAKVLGVLGRPQQAVAETIQAGLNDLGIDAEKDYGNGKDKHKERGGYKDALRALAGKPRWDSTKGRYVDNLEFSSALGLDAAHVSDNTPMKLITGAANVAGAIATDPLVFVGGSSAKGAKAGLEAGAEVLSREGAEAATPQLSRQLARQGAESLTQDAAVEALKRVGFRKGLTAEQKAAARELIKEGTPESLTTKGILSRTPKTVEIAGDRGVGGGFRRITGRELRSGAERTADNAIEAANRFDRGGFRVAGRSLSPEAVRSPIRGALRSTTSSLGTDAAEAAVRTNAAGKLAALSKSEDFVGANRLKALDRLEEKIPGLSHIAQSTDYDAARAAIVDSDLAEPVRKELNTDISRIVSQDKKLADLAVSRRELTAAADSGVSALIEHDPGLIDATAPVRERTPGSVPGIGTFSENRLSRWARTAFQPRTDILRSSSLPEGTAEEVYQRAGRARMAAGQEGEQLVRRLGKAVAEAKPTHEDYAAIQQALDIGGDVASTSARFVAEGKPEIAKLLDETAATRSGSFDTLLEHGLASPSKLRDSEDYLSRIITPEGREALRKAEARGGSVSQAVSPFLHSSEAKKIGDQGGSLLARTVEPDLPLAQFEEKFGTPLREAGLLKKDAPFVEMNPVAAVAKRGNEVIQAKQQAQFIDDLGEIKGTLGNPLVTRVRPDAPAAEIASAAKKAQRQGLVAVDLGGSGTAYAHPDLVPEINNVFSILSDDQAVSAFDRTLKGWNNVWKAYATTPLIGGPSFVTRNATGNLFNNFIRGITNPKWYYDAAKMQLEVRSALKEFPHLSIPEALTKAGAEPATIAKVEGALQEGAIGEGFFHVDLGADELQHLGNKKTGLTPDWRLSAKDPSRLPGVATGRKLNQAVEDNARMAHFLYALDDTGSIADAGSSVKKYLFDYGDLTEFERRRLKNINAFYTFTRKNTPLQFAELARNPSKFNQMNYIEQGLFGQGNADPGKAKVPKYLSDYGTLTGPDVGRALSGTKNPVVASLDTPLKAAVDTVNPLVQLAASVPGLRRAVPNSLKDENPLQSLGQSEVGLFSGGPAEFVKFGAEEATGHSLFTGASLTDQDGTRKTNALLRLSNAFAPIISKTNRTYGDPFGLEASSVDPTRLRATRAILGLNIKSVTDEMSTKEALQAKRQIDDTIKTLTGGLSSSERWALITSLRNKQSKARSPKEKRALQDQIDAVVDVPDLAELRAIGVVPKPVRPARPS